MRVIETFQITGRGLAVAVDEPTDLPAGKRLLAMVIKPDGERLTADAYKEWLLRHTPKPVEGEAFLLMGLAAEDVPVGSEIRVKAAD
jgi:hypothetical protein